MRRWTKAFGGRSGSWCSLLGVVLAGCSAGTTAPDPGPYLPEIPRTWSDEAVAGFELPLAEAAFSPRHVSQDYYYRLPERRIWKSYPVYHPDHEPEGYRDGLALMDPEIAFDEAALVREEDWIAAGARVFRAPISYDGPTVRPDEVLDPSWYERNGVGTTRDGIFPYARWVIREKGKIELGVLSCAMCHTRLMPDGSIIEGAQGNFPFDRIIADKVLGGVPLRVSRAFSHVLVDAPWVGESGVDEMSAQDLAAGRRAVPPGVLLRQGTSFRAPARIPDLIGIRDRRYLDATGLVIHRGIGDLMRYAAVNQTLDVLASFGDFVPESGGSELPPPGTATSPGTYDRFTDAQLFALAKYVYSLSPPPNPNPFDGLARRGQQVFENQGCAACHAPPLYTDNRLVPAPGFEPPSDHYDRFDVSGSRTGTDPTLATTTRRGTGYYKVPSLRGLWYRGPLEHSGSIATLEDWFDPGRLEDDYMPTGFSPYDQPRRPVPGHEFGLRLSADDKRALIAFLRTL